MLETTNYKLKKIELADSPPDITAINPNWDTIDAKLKTNEEQINNLDANAIKKDGSVAVTNTLNGTTFHATAQGGQFMTESWGNMQDGSDGIYRLLHNAYFDGVNYRYMRSHIIIGARGIVFDTGGMHYFDTGSIASTADEIFTPTLHRIWYGGGTAKLIYTGTGSPEGVITAPVGAIYLRTDGGLNTTFYVKEEFTGNVGWKAK